MFFELIAAIAAGFLGAGVALIVSWVSGRRIPRWFMPVVAGAAMLGYALWSEYSWYDRTVAKFPNEIQVVATHEARASWRPWTYLLPYTDRFVAVDPASTLRHGSAPDQRMATLTMFGRWAAPRVQPMVFDCAGARAAPVVDTVEYDDRGVVMHADWAPVPKGDPALALICGEE